MTNNEQPSDLRRLRADFDAAAREFFSSVAPKPQNSAPTDGISNAINALVEALDPRYPLNVWRALLSEFVIVMRQAAAAAASVKLEIAFRQGHLWRIVLRNDTGEIVSATRFHDDGTTTGDKPQ